MIGRSYLPFQLLEARGACLRSSMAALVIASIFCFLPNSVIAREDGVASATWSVANRGFFKNRKLKRQLDLIFNEEKPAFNSSEIEDAALILISYMESEGFLAARAIATLESLDGAEETVEWDRDFDVFLPRDTEASRVKFHLETGPRFYYETLTIAGNKILDTSEVEAFFYAEPLMFQSDKSRLFTPSLLQGGKGNLQAHLNTLGYLDASVDVSLIESDLETGACIASVSIVEGPRHTVEDVEVSVTGEASSISIDTRELIGQPYSRFISQDIARELRNSYYEMGYPDTVVKTELMIEDKPDGEKGVVIRATVDPGSQVFISSISISGSETTKPSLIRSRLELKKGDPLNPALLDRSRLNLSRLGVFDRVSYELGALDEDRKSVQFNLSERTTWNVDTLLGWGSYEQLRGGLIVEKMNLFGMGHRARVKTIASLKSQLGEFRYLLPEVFGTPTSLSAKVFGLKREEIAFDREDFGLDIGLSRKFDQTGIDVDTVYSIRTLDVTDNELVDELANQGGLTVGSFELRLGRDRRDSALNPRDGYRVSSQFEWASEAFGGEVDFQLAEFSVSFHDEISRGLYWHAGFTHGVVGSLSKPQKQVPASVLYYPGGENSVRGYQRSEAAPREGDKFKGAQALVLLNLELEQSFSKSLSLVLFVDALGTASNIDAYPFDETLTSAGLGVRFKTFMGPIRVEYGHNLNPRVFDPDGTLHFALGYPF